MYNIIERGTNYVLASFNGTTWTTAREWCDMHGYTLVSRVNSRNYFVTRSN